MNQQQRLFLVDNDATTRQAVKALAVSIGLKAEHSSSAEDFQARCDGSSTGCLIVELRLPGMSGLELLEWMGRKGLWIPTVVLTAFADVASAVRAMQAGAMTVVEKPLHENCFFDLIRNILAIGDTWRRRETEFDEARSRLDSLSADEKQLLDLILAGRTNKAIGACLNLGLRTVEGRRHSIMNKMKCSSLAQLVKTACEARHRPVQPQLNDSTFLRPHLGIKAFDCATQSVTECDY